MIFQKKFANNFVVKDSVVEADVDLFGGPTANCVVLHSIRAIEPIKQGLNSDRDSLVAYLAEEIMKDKKWQSVAIMHNNIVLFSTDNEVRRGDRIGTRVQKIGSGAALGFSLRSIVQAVREVFQKRK